MLLKDRIMLKKRNFIGIKIFKLTFGIDIQIQYSYERR